MPSEFGDGSRGFEFLFWALPVLEAFINFSSFLTFSLSSVFWNFYVFSHFSALWRFCRACEMAHSSPSTIFVDLRPENFCFFTTKSSYSVSITDNCIDNRVENQSQCILKQTDKLQNFMCCESSLTKKNLFKTFKSGNFSCICSA